MNIIEENTQIKNMYIARHKHDKLNGDEGFEYDDKILQRTLSPILYNNTNNKYFLTILNNMIATMFQSIYPVRNLFFYTHDKYYKKHAK